MPHRDWTIWRDERQDESCQSHPWCLQMPTGLMRGKRALEVAEVLEVFRIYEHEKPTPENIAAWVENHPGLRWEAGS